MKIIFKTFIFLCLFQITIGCEQQSFTEILLETRGDASKADKEDLLNVIRNRITYFGADFHEVKYKNENQIIVKVNNVKDENRLCKILSTTFNLEIWETFDCGNNEKIKQYLSDLEKELKSDEKNNSNEFSIYSHFLNVYFDRLKNSAQLGLAFENDTAKVNKIFSSPAAKKIANKYFAPDSILFLWTNKPVNKYDEDGKSEIFYDLAGKPLNENNNERIYGLIVIKASKQYNYASPVTSDCFALVKLANTRETDTYQNIEIRMNYKGSRAFAKLTRENINKNLPIVVDGSVFSYPYVNSEITSGNCLVSNFFSREETEDAIVMLKSGKLPISVKVVEIINSK